jgi:hypothetical protein
MRCTAALLSRTYVFAAFDGRWPGVTFLILALSGKLALGPIAPGRGWQAGAGGVNCCTAVGELPRPSYAQWRQLST